MAKRKTRASPLDNQIEYALDFQPKVNVGKGPHDAASIAAELLRIETKRRVLRPTDVVEEARDPDSPLHRYFSWDDGEAAQKWREDQARGLIASVRVKITTTPERPPLRAFLHVPSTGQAQHYGSAAKVMSDPERRRLVLSRALTELDSFKKRYAEIEELAVVFAAAEEVATRVQRAA